jgi:predicted  nucleic acid-binding Zn-ribbon protein
LVNKLQNNVVGFFFENLRDDQVRIGEAINNYNTYQQDKQDLNTRYRSNQMSYQEFTEKLNDIENNQQKVIDSVSQIRGSEFGKDEFEQFSE